jgi:hypothetical protein
MSQQKKEPERERRSTVEVDALKARVLEVKKRLPPGVISLFVSRFPEFNTYKKSSRVNNVLTLRIVDEEITDLLENLAVEYESRNQKGEKIF